MVYHYERSSYGGNGKVLKMKKIAIIGAQNCGKTTSLYYLSYKLKKRGRKLGIGHEVARECPYPLNESGGVLTQLWILFKQMEREAKLEDYYDKIIMDRSVYDSIPYCQYLEELKIMEKKDLEFCTEVAMAWGRNHPYSLIIYLESLPLEEDPARGSNSLDYQKTIERNFEKLLKTIKSPIIRVDIAPKEERCMEVYRIVRNYLYGRRNERIFNTCR